LAIAVASAIELIGLSPASSMMSGRTPYRSWLGGSLTVTDSREAPTVQKILILFRTGARVIENFLIVL
jgi:hypothetical protein